METTEVNKRLESFHFSTPNLSVHFSKPSKKMNLRKRACLFQGPKSTKPSKPVNAWPQLPTAWITETSDGKDYGKTEAYHRSGQGLQHNIYWHTYFNMALEQFHKFKVNFLGNDEALLKFPGLQTEHQLVLACHRDGTGGPTKVGYFDMFFTIIRFSDASISSL